MEESKKLLKKTKQKFFLFSFFGILLVLVVSFIALNIHGNIVSQQASIQKMYSMIGAQFGLVSKISSLSERFDQIEIGDDESEVKAEFLNLLTQLNSLNVEFNSWLAKNEFTNVQNIEELLKIKDVDKKMLLFMKRARELAINKNLTRLEVKQHIKFITESSREGIGEVFLFISAKLDKEQAKSLNSLNQTGFFLVGLCLLQVIAVWLLVFKPLYTTILLQNQKISNALLRARSANRSKTDFLANISHEIRTPMTAIMGYADLLKRDDIPVEEKESAVQIIDKNATHLLGLIDEILDISKIEAGKFDFENEKIDLSNFLNEVYSLINVKSEEKGIELIFKNQGKIPKFIMADPKRLKQILFNILGNAIKFTNKGYVELKVSFEAERKKLMVKIKDTGVGISKENRKKLFRPFEQGDTSVNREFGGTGLGLVLSKGLARGMGGDVNIVESKLGIGTTFEVIIDAGEESDEHLLKRFSTNIVEEKVEPLKGSELNNRKILVVDDAKENARLFKLYLEEAGAVVEVANDGETALEKASSQFFDIVLLDLQMPGKDGYQVIRELRKKSFERPIAALTAHAMKEERDKTAEAGFDDHITKPVQPKVLVEKVRSLLSDSTIRNH